MRVKPQYKIAVTGVGALIGQGIVRSLLRDERSWILGIDRRLSLFSEKYCNSSLQKPNCSEDEPEYLKFWFELIDTHQIDLIIPGISIDVFFLLKHRSALEDRGVVLALNDAQLIKLSEDKSEFSKDYKSLNLPQIETVGCDATWEQACNVLGAPPFILKPARGEGSQGIHNLFDECDFNYWTQRTTKPQLIQRIIGNDNDEYTVGIFGLGDGAFLNGVTLKRTLTRSGFTGSAEVVSYSAIDYVVRVLASKYSPIGPTNLQFRMENDKAYLLEINPRFSSSTSIKMEFGFNEAAMCLDFYLENKVPDKPTIRKGVAQRHSADIVNFDRHSF